MQSASPASPADQEPADAGERAGQKPSYTALWDTIFADANCLLPAVEFRPRRSAFRTNSGDRRRRVQVGPIDHDLRQSGMALRR